MADEQIYGVIDRVVTEVSEKIKVVVVSRRSVAAKFKANSKVLCVRWQCSECAPPLRPRAVAQSFELKRLSSSDAASLFSKLTASRWRPSDIKENIKVLAAGALVRCEWFGAN